ncbi:MAG: hypothetical protein AMQ74_00995 [Candidatus Methanofastidiosum methylothiophilum]|uniref:Uncharacterized protein n=1 Tax=Candidatus Methanofastidiosum methylothiophilum TaxID=1705564 RepID=A0A150J3K1_9EURY|nr:MAG: hypothetical protein AMQ74_00995 [Candidatus Methanofastidiosum methylthiophilus]
MNQTSNSLIHVSVIMFAVSLFLAQYALISEYIYSESLSVFLLLSSIIFMGSFITAFKSSKLKEDNIRKEAFINTSFAVFILGLVIMILSFFLVTLRI